MTPCWVASERAMSKIHFTLERYHALIRAHDQAVKDGRDEFEFEGKVLLVSYAVHLIEYLNYFFPKPGQVH